MAARMELRVEWKRREEESEGGGAASGGGSCLRWYIDTIVLMLCSYVLYKLPTYILCL